MANPEHIKILKKGRDAWNKWRDENPVVSPNFCGIDLIASVDPDRVKSNHQLDLSEYNFSNTQFANSEINNVIFRKAILNDCDFRGAILSNTHFDYAILSNANMKDAVISKCSFSNVNLQQAILESQFVSPLYFGNSNLTDAQFSNTNISECNFEAAILLSTNLTGAKASQGTNFSNSRVSGCRIDRFTLEQMKNYGGLTKGQLMEMDIQDPVATMRMHFSGFWQLVHILFISLWLLPYVVFAVKCTLLAKTTAGAPSVSIGWAFLQFIWTGGDFKDFSFWPFSAFIVALIYNSLRIILLGKTKELEMKETCSGLPPIFSLKSNWGYALNAFKLLFFINIAFVLVHTWHFACNRIPKDALGQSLLDYLFNNSL